MEYWKECIEEAFCEAGIKANEDQIKAVVEWVEGAHENIGMATGSECMPNPADSEIESLKNKIKRLESNHQRQLDGIAKGVAHRRSVSVEDVSIDDHGHITYR